MTIPETQLETWSHQGSITQSSDTYNAVRKVLNGGTYDGRAFEIFLQGSYGNDTNIYAESDVDTVICLQNLFHSDLDFLDQAQATAQQAAYTSVNYNHSDFKRDVRAVLTTAYGGNVVPGGNKAIAIEANGNRRKTDVIVALKVRRYHSFFSTSNESYTEGICFFNSQGERIDNFPKQHSANLTTKHQATKKRFKPMVRILKNARSRCVERGLLKKGQAPSYYIEGLLYNLPNDKFETTYQRTYLNLLIWLGQVADKDKLLCANEQYYLLRDGSNTCWPRADAEAFIGALTNLWTQW
jgi:hypothetical protein